MLNEDVYYQLFSGLKFKKQPQVPISQDFQRLFTLLESKEWLDSKQRIIRTSLEDNDFLGLFQSHLLNQEMGPVKFEAYASSVIIKVNGSQLTLVLESSKASPETKKRAAALKLLEMAKSPLFGEVIERTQSQQMQSFSFGIEDFNNTSQFEEIEESKAQIVTKFFDDSESSEEKEGDLSRTQIDSTIKKSRHLEDKKPMYDKDSILSPSDNMSMAVDGQSEAPNLNEFPQHSFDRHETKIGASSIQAIVPEIKPIPQSFDLKEAMVFQTQSNLITNAKFKRDLCESDNTTTPRGDLTPRELKEFDESKSQIPDIENLPLANFSVTKLFEDIYLKEYLQKSEIEKERENHSFPVQVGVSMSDLTADWFTERLVQVMTQEFKKKDLELFVSLQECSDKKSKTHKNVLFLIKSKEGKLQICESIKVASHLDRSLFEKLALFRFLTNYFPLVAAKLAMNTLQKKIKRIKKVEFDLPPPTNESQLTFDDKPKEPKKSSIRTSTIPNQEFSFAHDPTLDTKNAASIREQYVTKNMDALTTLHRSTKGCDKMTGDKLDDYFGYEVIHKPGASVLMCLLPRNYRDYKRKAQRLLGDSERLESLKTQLKGIKGLQEAVDLITLQLFGEVVVALPVKDKPAVAAIFMNSKDPTLIVEIRLDCKKVLQPKDFLAFGSMIFLRLATKELYGTVLSLWKKTCFEFVNN
jgi:hypothetical protein